MRFQVYGTLMMMFLLGCSPAEPRYIFPSDTISNEGLRASGAGMGGPPPKQPSKPDNEQPSKETNEPDKSSEAAQSTKESEPKANSKPDATPEKDPAKVPDKN